MGSSAPGGELGFIRNVFRISKCVFGLIVQSVATPSQFIHCNNDNSDYDSV